MTRNAPKKETVAEYKQRLRRTALTIPAAVVRKAIGDIIPRAAIAEGWWQHLMGLKI